MSTCTKDFNLIHLPNKYIRCNFENIAFVNTIAFGTAEFKDSSVTLRLLDYCSGASSKLSSDVINAFFIIQSLSQPFIVEKILKNLRTIFGPEMAKSSIIVATFGNKFDMDVKDQHEDYEDNLNNLRKISEEYGIAGGVFDFRGYYFRKDLRKNANSSEEAVVSTMNELGKIVGKFPGYNVKFQDQN